MNNKEREIYDKYAYDRTFNYIFLIYMEFERRVNSTQKEYETLKRGECRFDYVSWENRLNISHYKMVNAIKILIQEDYIKQINKGKKNIASIYYLSRFDDQQSNQQNKQQNNQQNKYSNINCLDNIEQQNHQQNNQQEIVQSSKYNNPNITSNNIFIENSKEMMLAKLLFSLMQSNNPKVKQPNFQSWSKEFDYILRIDKREIEDVTKLIRWCQSNSFWKSNILSPKKLREKYDMLYLKMIEESRKNQKSNYKIIDFNDTREKYYR